MPKRSAGLLLFRRRSGEVDVLLAHPGGPFWSRRDAGAWSIPKGELEPGEDPLAAALREFEEETGHRAPDGPVIALGDLVQPSRKIVTAFGVEADFDPDRLNGATIQLEWPPRSGRHATYPEIDRVAWLGLAEARTKILPGQREFLARLEAALSRER